MATAPTPVTALALIDRAYSLLGFKAAGEPLSADDAQYGLDALNAMLDGWNTQPMSVVSVGEAVANISGNSATVGPGQTFDIVRPTRLESGSFSRINGIDYPVKEIDRGTYAHISLKSAQGYTPEFIYFDANMPTATVYFYPQPLAGIEFHLAVQTPLTEFASATASAILAPGYRKAIEYSLAEELAPGIKEVSMMVVRTAANARRAIRRTNVSVAQLDSGIQNARFNIFSGT